MKLESKEIQRSLLAPLHGSLWIERQRKAGAVLANIMTKLQNVVSCKEEPSLLEMDKFVEEEINRNGCTPTFKGYKGYPNALITSVNKQLVHGIPSDYQLQDGDLISFDFGVTFEGSVADSATTLIFGKAKNSEHERMVSIGETCLYNAIKAIRPGLRIGVIGNSIYKTARHAGFQVISDFGGHSLSWDSPHEAPFVSNKSTVDEGIHIQPGMTLAIEPLLVPGNCSTKTRKADDGWTIYTEDISSHHEHTIFIHEDRVEIMTHRLGESIPREVPFCQTSIS